MPFVFAQGGEKSVAKGWILKFLWKLLSEKKKEPFVFPSSSSGQAAQGAFDSPFDSAQGDSDIA
jgi:hypothetical protein